jgi:hypothetical protein
LITCVMYRKSVILKLKGVVSATKFDHTNIQESHHKTCEHLQRNNGEHKEAFTRKKIGCN